jgi:hypothetical protein
MLIYGIAARARWNEPRDAMIEAQRFQAHVFDTKGFIPSIRVVTVTELKLLED